MMPAPPARISPLAPQHAQPFAHHRLSAPPPEYRHMSVAPANHSRPPSPPCSSPAQRLLAPAAVQNFHPRTRARAHAACQQPLRTHVNSALDDEKCREGRPLNHHYCFKGCAPAQRLSFVQVCEARALGFEFRQSLLGSRRLLLPSRHTIPHGRRPDGTLVVRGMVGGFRSEQDAAQQDPRCAAEQKRARAYRQETATITISVVFKPGS